MAEMSDDFRDLKKNLKKMVDAQASYALKVGQAKAISLGAETKIVNNRYLDVNFIKRNTDGVIDLKAGFEKGASAHKKKLGGWYTIVPIRRKVSSLSNSAYNEVRDLEGIPSSTRYIDILYGGHSLSDESLSAFGVTTKPTGGNLTRVANGEKRGSYYAFRTVSDNSAPNSWLLITDMAKQQAEEYEKLKQIGQVIQDTLSGFGKESS